MDLDLNENINMNDLLMLLTTKSMDHLLQKKIEVKVEEKYRKYIKNSKAYKLTKNKFESSKTINNNDYLSFFSFLSKHNFKAMDSVINKFSSDLNSILEEFESNTEIFPYDSEGSTDNFESTQVT